MTTPDDTRSRILAAARELFAERGYAGTSLADIAAAVGLTKTAVAYHFHPKDRLASELLSPAADEMLTLLGADHPDRKAFVLDDPEQTGRLMRDWLDRQAPAGPGPVTAASGSRPRQR